MLKSCGKSFRSALLSASIISTQKEEEEKWYKEGWKRVKEMYKIKTYENISPQYTIVSNMLLKCQQKQIWNSFLESNLQQNFFFILDSEYVLHLLFNRFPQCRPACLQKCLQQVYGRESGCNLPQSR